VATYLVEVGVAFASAGTNNSQYALACLFPMYDKNYMIAITAISRQQQSQSQRVNTL
jgi:hypothetical protein